MLDFMLPLVYRLRYGAFTAEEISTAAIAALGRGDKRRYEQLRDACVAAYGAEMFMMHGRVAMIHATGIDPRTGQTIEAESYAVH